MLPTGKEHPVGPSVNVRKNPPRMKNARWPSPLDRKKRKKQQPDEPDRFDSDYKGKLSFSQPSPVKPVSSGRLQPVASGRSQPVTSGQSQPVTGKTSKPRDD